MHFDFIMVVWGPSFTDLFLHTILPNQLTPGNLLHFTGRDDATYKIYTRNCDAEVIKRSPVFMRLRETVATEIISIDGLIEAIPTTHYALTAAHKRAIASATVPGNTGFVFLCPDAIVSEGTFANLDQLAAEGCRAVMVPGMRLVKETFLPEYHTRYFGSAVSAPIRPRELVALALRHLHPLSQCMFWHSRYFSAVPSHLYWNVGGDGVLLRCFHLHPLFVNPVHAEVAPSGTIDGDFLLRACPNPDEIHIVEDSDEMAVFEVSPQLRSDYLPKRRGQLRRHKAGTLEISRWSVFNTDPRHRQLVRRVLRVHAKDIDERWAKAERRSERVVRDLLRLYPSMRIICQVPGVLDSAIQEIRARVRIRTRLRHGIVWLAERLRRTQSQHTLRRA